MSRGVQRVVVARFGGGERGGDDAVIVEEPLEIRVAGETLAVTMRTPGHDRELALGFLWAEGIVRSLDEVGGVAHCVRGDDPDASGNTIDVTPAPGARLRLPEGDAGRRGTLTTSACGVCGRRAIDDLLARCTPVRTEARLRRQVLVEAAEGLRRTQPLFADSGGCHGAALFHVDGTHLVTFEDVGRHNAVDKLVGSRLLSGGLPARDQLLVVSGRTSFEIVQKAAVAGIPFVAGVSAPSSLAIEVARRADITLAGFVRGERFAVYHGAGRIDG